MLATTSRYGNFLVVLLGIGSITMGPKLASAQISGIPDTIERCRVIAQELTDYDDNTRLVFEQFCELMHNEAVPAPSVATENAGPPDYFVKCVVAGDPDWIGFRLVTRQQCDAMRGAELAQKQRGFGPK